MFLTGFEINQDRFQTELYKLVLDAGEPVEFKVTRDKQLRDAYVYHKALISRESVIAQLRKGLTPIKIMWVIPTAHMSKAYSYIH